MNNEVLRRKMFRTILADSRAPNGILASSPEMVETVQRRANGGINTGGLGSQTVSDIFNRGRGTPTRRDLSGAGMPEGTLSYLQVLEQIKDLPYNKQTEVLRRLGFGAEIGPDITRTATVDPAVYETETSKNIMSFIESLKGTGEVARPGPTTTQARVASGVQSLLGPKFDAFDPRTEPAMAMATPAPDKVSVPGSTTIVSPEMLRVLRGDELGGKVLVEDVVDDEYTSMPPIRPGEDLAATQPATPAEKPEAAKPETGKVTSASIAKLENLQQDAQSGNLLTPGGKPKTKLNADEAATPEAANALSIVLPEKVSLSEMEEEAKKIMGFDPSKAKEDKKASFWRNLTMAGLAIAAGESENALTNVAKGLMVGLDSYSKDVKELSAQEAEERKEYRATLRTLIKDKRDENIAMAGLQNDFNYKVADLNQRKKQFESTQAFEQEKLGLQMSLAGKQLEVSIATSLAELDLKQQTLDETQRQNIITNQLNQLIKKPDFVQNAVAIGLAEVDADGKTTWTDEGKTWLADNTSLILTSSLTSSKSTTGQAYTPSRFAQEVLKTEDGRASIAAEMIMAFPERFNNNNPPTLAEMQSYVAGSGTSSFAQQPAASATPVTITTKEQYDNLPSGAEFIQNGQRRRKP